MRAQFGKWMLPWLVFAAGVWTSGLGVALAQTLEITPRRALVDEVAVIRATGLTPGEHVSIQAELMEVGGVGRNRLSVLNDDVTDDSIGRLCNPEGFQIAQRPVLCARLE